MTGYSDIYFLQDYSEPRKGKHSSSNTEDEYSCIRVSFVDGSSRFLITEDPFFKYEIGKMTDKLSQRISINPEVMAGKPVIRGTQIPVELIVRMLSQGISESEIIKEYPGLQIEDIRAALNYAAQVLANEDVFPH